MRSRDLLPAFILIAAAPAAADPAAPTAAAEPEGAVAYPRIQVLRPPVFPVGMMQAGSAIETRPGGGGTTGAFSLRAGFLDGLEAGLAVVTPLATADVDDPGTQIRVRVDRAIYDGRHLELTTTLRAEYDVSELDWSHSAFEAALTYQLGAVMLRAGGEGLDAALDHAAVELDLPLAVGAQFGAHVYLEACALLVTGSGEDGNYTQLSPVALFAAFNITPAFDVVAGISDDTLYLGAFYRFAL